MGEGEKKTVAGKKAMTTPDTGGTSVSEKSQVMCTSKNPFEKSCSQQEYFVPVVKDRRIQGRKVWSS